MLKELRKAVEEVLEEIASDNSRFDEFFASMKQYLREERVWLNDCRINRDFRFKIWSSDEWGSDVKINGSSPESLVG